MRLLFAWRYFKAKKSTNAINIIAWVSIGAIIVGTTALILVLSVFNGFEDLVKSLYSSFYTDLKITPAQGKSMTLSQQQLVQLKGLNGIRDFAKIIEEKALVQNGEYQSVIYLKGVDEQYRYITGIADNIVKGDYELGNEEDPRLLLGGGIEGALGIQADRNIFILRIYLPRKSESTQLDLLNDISNDSIRTSAAFRIQQDFDNKYGITNIDFVRKALRYAPDQYSSLEIAINDPDKADDLSRQVKSLFGKDYVVQTRYEQNQSLYSVMNLERWIIYAVLCLLLVVAAFNMIGSLTMLVLEKQKDIGILHALGANNTFIRQIFLAEGMLLAGIGTVVGMLLAALICWLQVNYKIVPLEGASFLIDYFPVKMRITDFLLVAATVFVIALLAAWLPARKASLHEFQLRAE